MHLSPTPPLSFSDIRLIAFDADDTLWDNQSHFEKVEHVYCDILSPYGQANEVSAALFDTETRNMPLLGYGCKAFIISLIENAITISHGRIPASDLLRIVQLGKDLLSFPTIPLPHVVETLEEIRATKIYKMVVFTKGDLLDQQNKLTRSGLTRYFDDVVVVADKTRKEYIRLCHVFDVDVHRLLMVGNSFKSDVEPVLQLGGHAVHIPFHTTWQHEKVEEYQHSNLIVLENIRQLVPLLCKPSAIGNK